MSLIYCSPAAPFPQFQWIWVKAGGKFPSLDQFGNGSHQSWPGNCANNSTEGTLFIKGICAINNFPLKLKHLSKKLAIS